MFKEKLEVFYFKHYKKLIIIPALILILALISIGIHNNETGDFFNKDVSLKGGLTATIYTDKVINIEDLQKSISVDSTLRILSDPSSGKNIGLIVEVSDMAEPELKSFLEKYLGFPLADENYSLEETNASLGESFYQDLIKALLFAFLLMGVVVFVTFRNIIPSLGVIQAAFSDIVITLAIINILEIKISTAGIVAFLLVVGYSIDSDILLTSRVLKEKEGKLFDRFYGAIKTGLTMTGTTLAALLVGYLFTSSIVIKQMFLILLIALTLDIFTTYITNAGLLVWYLKSKGQQ